MLICDMQITKHELHHLDYTFGEIQGLKFLMLTACHKIVQSNIT